MKTVAVDPGALAEEMRALPRLDYRTLVEKWGTLYGAPPPRRASRSLLMRAVAYRLQERAYGGLQPRIARSLAAMEENTPAAPASSKLRPGTVLLREWHGEKHQVTVMEDGVLFQGRRFGSLSEVARVITGSRWSGPRFFGLHGQS